MVKVSIIVPIYNSETYLPRCLASLKAQSLKDIEIILIDDGSMDRSGIIADEAARGDQRIRVIHQQNRGVSATRNVGLEVVTGEFIAFVDSDDWVEPMMYKAMYDKAKKETADLVVCDFFEEEDGITYLPHHNMVDETVDIEKQFLARYFYTRVLTNKHFGHPTNKLYKKEMVDRFGIRFEESLKNSSEDLLFYLMCMIHIHRVSSIGISLYHYTFRSGSLSHQKKPKHLEEKRMMCERLSDAIDEYGLAYELRYFVTALWFRSTMTVLGYLTSTGESTTVALQMINSAFEKKASRVFFKRFAFGKAASIYCRYNRKSLFEQILCRLFALFIYLKFSLGLRVLIAARHRVKIKEKP
jgi:glycosyltransferase involved in cell wall biosynthesis